jgi:cytochrome c oxidase assembly protein subunit 11
MNLATGFAQRKVSRRDLVVAFSCGVFAASMAGMAYAAVPLYRWFCQATGFGGTTQLAKTVPGEVLPRTLVIRFDANVVGGLPWRFAPEPRTLDVKLGEVATALFTIRNDSARETVGQASYNVTPPTIGLYFSKINCFCFSEQRLRPGETREMTVLFFVDPALAQNPEDDALNTITLSYTMHPVHPADNVATVGPRVGRLR